MKKIVFLIVLLSLAGCGGSGGSSTPAINYGVAPVLACVFLINQLMKIQLKQSL